MEGQIVCSLCQGSYDKGNPPRILTMCGCTFCESCIKKNIIPNGSECYKIICPQDKKQCQLRKNDVSQFPICLWLLKLASQSKRKVQDQQESLLEQSEAKKKSPPSNDNKKQATKNTSTFQHAKSYKTINNTSTVQLTCQDPFLDDNSEELQNICLLHQKPLQIVCIVDLEKICSNCALFGQHKGHQFKTIEEIDQLCENLSQQILTVYDQKIEIITRLSSKTTKPDIDQVFDSKKSSLMKQIKQRFQKLYDLVKTEQQKAFAKLQKIFAKMGQDIQTLYQVDLDIVNKYDEWEKISFQKLQLIENGTFEDKLRLLFVQQSAIEYDYAQQGKNIVELFRRQQDEIFIKAEEYLDSIKLNKNDVSFTSVKFLVQVTDSIEELKGSNWRSRVFKNKDKQNDLKASLLKKYSQSELLMQRIQQEERKKLTSSEPMKNIQNIEVKIGQLSFFPYLEGKYSKQKSYTKQHVQFSTQNSLENLQNLGHSRQKISRYSSRQKSSISGNDIRILTKKHKTIKVPEKYESVMNDLYADNLHELDLTNAELGDSIVQRICQLLPGSKVQKVKLIRNKLTNQCIYKILPYLENVVSLNLSQNMLTTKVLDILIQNRGCLPKINTIVLSLNKIKQRAAKVKLDQLKKLGIAISV